MTAGIVLYLFVCIALVACLLLSEGMPNNKHSLFVVEQILQPLLLLNCCI